MRFKIWLATRLRNFADRIDRRGAPKAISWHFTLELGKGVVFNEDRRGCRVWYYGDDEYVKAHEESESV